MGSGRPHARGRRDFSEKPYRNNLQGLGAANPDDESDKMYKEAIILCSRGKYNGAQAILNQIARENPGYDPHIRGLARQLLPDNVVRGPDFSSGRNVVASTTEEVLRRVEAMFSNSNPGHARRNK